MVRLILALIPVAFLASFVLTGVVRRFSVRAGALDTGPIAGQVKLASRRVPNTGGVAIVLAVVLPVLCLLAVLVPAKIDPHDWNLLPAGLHEHLAGIRSRAGDALVLLACVGALHVLGLVDDRAPIGAWKKLLAMCAIALAGVWLTGTRVLTLLDAHAPWHASGGLWLSTLVTVVWIVGITNAMNFLDNMDGLAASVAGVAGACFLWTALHAEQWFVGAVLALLVGACAGFLVYNFPWRGAKGKGASIFMGDGGSLVIGFLLAFLSVRITYTASDAVAHAGVPATSAPWWAVFMPVASLAVPLYDFLTVTTLRLRMGRSPMLGDTNHLSHRLVRRGLSQRAAVTLIACFTAVSGACGVLITQSSAVQACVLAGVVALLMVSLAILEFAGTQTGVQELGAGTKQHARKSAGGGRA